MSERPIQVGDLVQVVRSNGCTCGAPQKSLGRVFRVSAIKTYLAGSKCSDCKRDLTDRPYVCASDDGRREYGLPRLKRIPPLDELEGVRTEDKIKEPA
jgi:hypothetical protein